MDVLFAGVRPRFVVRGRRITTRVENRFDENIFSFQAGGGADIWLARVIGIRTGIDGRASYYQDERYGSWRFHTGVVFALGSR